MTIIQRLLLLPPLLLLSAIPILAQNIYVYNPFTRKLDAVNPGGGTPITGGACPAGQYSTGIQALVGVPTCSQVAFTQLSGSATKAQQFVATVYNDQSNSWVTGTQSFADAIAIVLKTGPAYAPTVSGHVGYDSTANDYVGGVNGTSFRFARRAAGTPTVGHCVQWGAGGTLDTAGAICGSGGGGGGITTLNGLTPVTQLFAKVDDTNVTLNIGSATATHTFTLGWTGRLSAARSHADAVYNSQVNAYVAGMKQSFASNGTSAALRLVPFAGAPSSLQEGDMYYDDVSHSMKCVEDAVPTAKDCVFSGVHDPGGNGVVIRTSPTTTTFNVGSANRIMRWVTTTTVGDSNLGQNASTGALENLKGTSDPATVVASGGTPVFNLSTSDSQDHTLTSNITFTFSNPPAAPAGAKFIRMIWRQNGTGGWTITCPGTVFNCIQPDPTPNAVTIQILQFDGTNYAVIASTCVATCASGYTDWYGKTTGHVSWGVRDVTGTPADVDVPSADPTAAGYVLKVTQAGSGATPTQLGWGPGPQFCAGTDTGGDDTYVISCPNFPAAYALDLTIRLTVATVNTGATTLDAGLGAKAIKLGDGTTDPTTGDLPAGSTRLLRYDPAANSAAGAWLLSF